MKLADSVPLPLFDKDNNPITEWNHTEVAAYIGIHRTTLLRMEQRSMWSPADWRRLPQPHRVYDKTKIEEIKQKIEAYYSRGLPNGAVFLDDKKDAAE